MCTCITDLVCRTAESNTKLYTNYTPINLKKQQQQQKEINKEHSHARPSEEEGKCNICKII